MCIPAAEAATHASEGGDLSIKFIGGDLGRGEMMRGTRANFFSLFPCPNQPSFFHKGAKLSARGRGGGGPSGVASGGGGGGPAAATATTTTTTSRGQKR